jgi:CheY-like chemotaxis protein
MKTPDFTNRGSRGAELQSDREIRISATWFELRRPLPKGVVMNNYRPSILVIDDDEDIRALIHLALTTEGYQVVEASNGQQALDQLQRWTPNLIVLDMHMPLMNGWTFLMHYLHDDRPHPPIIAMSSQVINAQLIPGIISFIAKPFDIARLVQFIRANTAASAAV